MMLLTEIGPTVVFVFVTRRSSTKTDTRETESEMKTYNYDQE